MLLEEMKKKHSEVNAFCDIWNYTWLDFVL